MLRSFLSVAALLSLTLLAVSQNSASQPANTPSSNDGSPALGDVVRGAKAQKSTHAKKVLTDDNMEQSAGPLPLLKMDGAENADDVVAAISTYKETHTPEQTEEAVRLWYEHYDEMLAAAIQENLDLKALRDENLSNGYELCQQSQDYQQCQNRRNAEMRGAQHDRAKMAENTNLMVRIQHSFSKIRNGLQRNSLQYDWFQIRTTNNIDRF
ncbi:MAG TPA: hypothetical protein VGS27_09835 [Candidatus Sulfotelmatobacter sp.]|nr:hypothetical protein [Candidatus Sulfotelmatobacter sp.]